MSTLSVRAVVNLYAQFYPPLQPLIRPVSAPFSPYLGA